MSKRGRDMNRRASGQAMVEFALVAPLFFLLLFSLIEFGRAVYYIQSLNNAAREGARYAITHGANSGCPSGPMPPTIPVTANPCDPTGAKIVSAVKNFAVGVIDSGPSDYAVTVKWCDNDGNVADCPDTNAAAMGDGSNGRDQNVVVSVTYKFRPLIGGIPLPTFTLTGGSTLVINH